LATTNVAADVARFVFNAGSDQQSLYLRWVTARPPQETISALEIHLETIDHALLEKAGTSGELLETRADAPRCGGDQNWHGLGIGRE
jgi:hypothetical protein